MRHTPTCSYCWDEPEYNTSPQNSSWRAVKCPIVKRKKNGCSGYLPGVNVCNSVWGKVSLSTCAVLKVQNKKPAVMKWLPSDLEVTLVNVWCKLVGVLWELKHIKQLYGAPSPSLRPKGIYFDVPDLHNITSGEIVKRDDAVWCGICAGMTVCVWFDVYLNVTANIMNALRHV